MIATRVPSETTCSSPAGLPNSSISPVKATVVSGAISTTSLFSAETSTVTPAGVLTISPAAIVSPIFKGSLVPFALMTKTSSIPFEEPSSVLIAATTPVPAMIFFLF